MTNTHNIHEITIITNPNGIKTGFTYRGVTIIGGDKRSTQFKMTHNQYGRASIERSSHTTLVRTMAEIDFLIDGGYRTVNAEGVMISAKDVK